MWVGIRNAFHGHLRLRTAVGETVRTGDCDLSINRRDRIAVRIPSGVIKELIHTFYEHVRHRVFEIFGFIMDFVPGVAQCLNQKRLKQSVTAHHDQCVLPAKFG